MDVVEKNTAMKKYTIRRFISGNATKPLKRFHNILAHHPCLRMLKLLDYTEVHVSTYRSLLQHLPKTLESLSLFWTIADKPRLEDFSENPWPSEYPCFQTISMSILLEEYEESTVIPLLQLCPNPQEIEFRYNRQIDFCSIATLACDPQHFPKLSRVALGWMDINPEWRVVITGMQNRIEEFTVYTVEIGEPLYPFYEELATLLSNTLEVLRLQYSGASSQQIRLILTPCPKLRTFSVFTALIDDVILEIRNFPGLDVWFDNYEVDWVCLGLENLEITFMDIRH
ncbi:hypothetical protein BGX26_000377 [Mortierella sp. AD094]|nr:hypothetical protein BGX26_000377 [Mortierella sp. AD094]